MMVSLGLLVLLVVVIAVVAARARASHAGGAGETLAAGGPAEPRSFDVRSRLADDLSRWVALGLLSPAQADAILTHEQPIAPAAGEPTTAAPGPPGVNRIPAIAEALGYLGGVLAVIGLGLIVARYWSDMATGGRLALSGGGALFLVGTGAVVHADTDPALARLRGFLWLGSTAAVALCAGVAAVDGFGVEDGSTVAVACSGMVAIESGLLWWRRERPLQQLTFLAGLCVFAGTAVTQVASEGPTGLAVWIVGAAYVFAGLRRRTPLPGLTDLAGAAAVVVGAMMVSTDWQAFGLLFAMTSASALVALAIVRGLAPDPGDQLVLGALGGIGLLQFVPGTLVYFASDAGVATGVATWLVGGGLVFAGARRLTRVPVVIETVGGGAIIGGAALTGVQWEGIAPIFGIATAVALVALGMLPGQVLLSVFGSIGLLVNVPWAIGWFFPGEGRAPLLIMVSGALIIGVAVLLTRMGGRFRRELDLHSGAKSAPA